MKKRRQMLTALYCLILVISMALTACGNNKEALSESVTEETTQEETTTELTQEVTDKTVDSKETTEEKETISETEETTQETAKEKAVIVFTSFEEIKVMYAKSSVNVRSGPDTSYEVVSHLSAGQKVDVTGQAEKNGWYQLMIDGVAAYVSNHYLSDQMVEVLPKQEATPNQTNQNATSAGGIIMVGDSRCVQMQTAVSGGGCAWVCENSKGYDWFVEKAIPRIDPAVGKGTKIVINLGVNDPGNVKKYAEMVNAKAVEWTGKGASVYFVSVNPVWENPYTTEEQVTTFNSTIPSLLSSVTWIDTHSWLINNGYRVVDGLHYDDPTYVNIYNLIMGSI